MSATILLEWVNIARKRLRIAWNELDALLAKTVSSNWREGAVKLDSFTILCPCWHLMQTSHAFDRLIRAVFCFWVDLSFCWSICPSASGMANWLCCPLFVSVSEVTSVTLNKVWKRVTLVTFFLSSFFWLLIQEIQAGAMLNLTRENLKHFYYYFFPEVKIGN